MISVKNNPSKLYFPADNFTLPAGDSTHAAIPKRVLDVLKRKPGLVVTGTSEASDDDGAAHAPRGKRGGRRGGTPVEEPRDETTPEE